ncbi:hypothetical protein D3C80_1804180 [compost metagenome]
MYTTTNTLLPITECVVELYVPQPKSNIPVLEARLKAPFAQSESSFTSGVNAVKFTVANVSNEVAGSELGIAYTFPIFELNKILLVNGLV